MERQRTLLQGFEWYLPEDAGHWRRLAGEAKELWAAGFTGVWMPPAYKGIGGVKDVGYGVYDLYDLGEFDQKGGIPTKYGTKAEYIAAIRAMQREGLEVLADIVVNHRMGADYSEQVEADGCAAEERGRELGTERITAWTGFTFPGRGGKYSDFCWNHTHFDGVDWDDSKKQSRIYQLEGKDWDSEVDKERGNYDYLMGADLDMGNPEVIAELDRWGAWYLDTAGMDGFRLDAVKHIRATFFTHWLECLRKSSGKALWAVGEYWHKDVEVLKGYLDASGNVMTLFDVPLHYNFVQASSSGGAFDMRRIFEGTLTAERPMRSVTFVDNHDTQPGQALQSWVEGWFKPLAYALILLRQEGTPCVFYGDRYGVSHDGIPPLGKPLDLLLAARQRLAWGEQIDYLDHQDVIGWVRLGDEEHPGSGLAVVMSNGPGGKKEMCMGVGFAGAVFTDLLGNQQGEVTLDGSGRGVFSCGGGSVSVWTQKKK